MATGAIKTAVAVLEMNIPSSAVTANSAASTTWIGAPLVSAPIHVVLAALFAVTALLGMFISNTATAVLMAPVAIAVANELQVSAYPLAMIVALAASTAFMTPVSSPVNTLVVTPGRYTFADFVRIGVPFSIVVLIVCVI